MRLDEASGLPASSPKPLTILITPFGSRVADEFRPNENARGRLLGRLDDDAIAGGDRRRELPCRHQNWKIPRDDLADDAERLMKMIGDRVVVDFRNAAFLRADGAGEIAEVVDGERNVGGGRLADRLAIVPGLGRSEKVEVLLHDIRDPVQDARAIRYAGLAPGVLGGMGGVERGLDVILVGTRDLANLLAGDRRDIVEVAAGLWLRPLAVDEIAVARLERRRERGESFVLGHRRFLGRCLDPRIGERDVLLFAF